MSEDEWLRSTDPTRMLEFLRGKVSDRKLRLFAVASCHRVRHLMNKDEERNELDVVERYADGLAAESERKLVHGWNRLVSVSNAASPSALDAAHFGAASALSFIDDSTAKAIEQESQARLLRCIFGNPFHPVTLEPSLLSDSVAKIAKAIYDERAFDRMPILADALEESGMADGEVIAHLRGPGPHCRGCFALDAVLSYE
ncbi:hypothetical protein AYO40_01735 [Planctomycetaceae bacterium SCGC AG-212-D15]|nr:hypothetical protein AYO40_01735 [Planctomycetaceae bacterium SCGC AG-212-D15]